jgi:PKD repeat protein
MPTISPTINVSISYLPDPVVEGEVVNFTAYVSSDGTETTGEWDFGEGPVSGGLTVTHTFADAGTYTIYYTATDVCGFSRAASAIVLVEQATWNTYLPLVVRNH